MRTIADITIELAAAEDLVRALRDERNKALMTACGRKPGDVFETNSMKYRVRSISAASKGSEVWLVCDYWTSAKKWSQGTKMVSHKVEG